MTRKTNYELGSDLVFGTALLACASFSATKHIYLCETTHSSSVSFFLCLKEVAMLPEVLGYLTGIATYILLGPWVVMWELIKKIRGCVK